MPFPWYNSFMKKRIIIVLTILSLLFSACGIPEPAHTAEKTTVRIAVIDTGFSSSAIPQHSIVNGKNYLDGALSTEDTYGHGTAIAYVILENCPDALLVPLVSSAFDDGKIIQVENDTLAKIIIDAVDIYECDIINISAGIILDKNSIRNAIQYAEEKGSLVVASVGNDYADYGEIKYYPAAYPTVLAVGSINKEEKDISTFSQRGEWVNIYACGEDVTIRTLSGNTRTSNGTSYSAAKITAYAANIIMQSENNLSPSELRQRIAESLETLPDHTKYLPEKHS